MATSSLSHERFSTNKAYATAWAQHWRPDPSVTSKVPRGALFSLISINQGARKVVLDNARHACKILTESSDYIVGLPAVACPGYKHGLLLTTGRVHGTIQFPDLKELSKQHAIFEVNLQSGIPFVSDVSNKNYTCVGEEVLDRDGRPCIKESKHPLTRDTRKAVLLPHMNTIVIFGTFHDKSCVWRTYWHKTEWDWKKRASEPHFNKQLAATRSFPIDDGRMKEQIKAIHKSREPKKTHLKLAQLGKGDYGQVYKAINMANGDLIAIKVQMETKKMKEAAMQKGRSQDWIKAEKVRQAKGLKSELMAYANVEHERIVRFHGWWSFNDRVEIYLDLKDGAAKLLKDPEIVQEDRKRGTAFDLLRDIASALVFLHGKGFVHRDIWSENILYDRDPTSLSGYRFFLGDMGHCLRETENLRHEVQWNVAPELWKSASSTYPHGRESDIWGLFTTVVEMISYRYFDDCPWTEGERIKRKVQEARFNFPEVQDFAHMAALTPGSRPPAEDVVKLTKEPGARDRFCLRKPTRWAYKSKP